MNDEKYFIGLEAVRLVTPISKGVELLVDAEKVRFEFVKDDVLKIKISQAQKFDANPTFAVIHDEFGSVETNIRETAKTVTVSSSKLSVKISKSPFKFDVVRSDGSKVIASVSGSAYKFLNNQWMVERKTAIDDVFLGLGEKTGGANIKGRSLTMWNTDILSPNSDGVVRDQSSDDPTENPRLDMYDPYYMSINLLYHVSKENSMASASYFDNGYCMHFDMTNDKKYKVMAEGGQLTEYVFAGPEIKDILKNYTDLTGVMQAPPLWSLGHHQCRWHNYSQKQWLELAAIYRTKKIPCDTLWLDIDYMDEYRVFTWNKKQFPDRKKAFSDLKDDGFRAITIVDPGVKYDPGYSVFDEGLEKNLFCKTDGGQTYIGQVWPGRTAFPDFVQEGARNWWGRLNAEHVESGLAGIWNDMNEPATGDIPNDAMRWDRDGENHPHERYHNQYAMLMAMGTVQGLKTAKPEHRTFVLSRAGFAGIQRYAANWTGDNCSDWSHLAMSVPMNCRLNICGQPFVGSDTGGFCDDTNEELLVRWYQYSAFQPFMRNHQCAGQIDQYPWSFGKKAESLIKSAIELRYQFMPYIYSVFMKSTQEATPIQTPLSYYWQDDPEALTNSTEYMFGEFLLVAPIVEEGQTERTLYLPKGSWYDFYTNTLVKGGRYITVDVQADKIPLFVKAGAIIPLAKVVQSTMFYHPKELELRAYLPTKKGKTVSVLHEDDGITDRWKAGDMLKTSLTLEKAGKQYKILAVVAGNDFPENKRKSFVVSFVGADIKSQKVKDGLKDFELIVG
jgi:alpha-glucosidase